MNREYSMFLYKCILNYEHCEIEGDASSGIKRLFDFDYGMPKEYRDLFQLKFYKRYKYYNINYDSYAMFKNQLESSLLELLPRYGRLYASQDIICNPFINYASQNDTITRGRGRNKNYNTDNAASNIVNNSRNGGINVNRTGTSEGNSGATSGSSEGLEKDKSTGDAAAWTVNKYSDSPQANIKDEDSFNDGYITNKNRESNRSANINSGVKGIWNKNSIQNTNSGFSNSESYSDNITEGEGTENRRAYSDSYSVSALENTNKRISQTYGLSGVTVSAVVQEWRDTFLNIDKMLLDELRPLFMLVY